MAGLAGCSNIEPVAPFTVITDPTQLYLSLTLNHPAVNLSTAPPYNTVQLIATPRNALGNPMSDLPAPTFHLANIADTGIAQVTADGLVTVSKTTNGVSVVAELTVGPILHADTAMITVKTVAPPPVLTSLSIHPMAPDSAIWAAPAPGFTGNNAIATYVTAVLGSSLNPTNKKLPAPRLMDTLGNAIATTGLQFEYTSLNPDVATVSRRAGATAGGLTGVKTIRPGQVRMVARTFLYGIAKADTVTFTVTPPAYENFTSQRDSAGTAVFLPSEVWIAPSGVVIWQNALGDTLVSNPADSVDVTFDDPTNVVQPSVVLCNLIEVTYASIFGSGPHCSAGNVMLPPRIVPAGPGLDGGQQTVQLRQFPVRGVYTFHSTRTGATGRIVVSPDLTLPMP